MNNIDNKELLLSAINEYPEITFSQKQILKVLVSLDAEVNVRTLMEVLKLKRQSVQPNLKKLEELDLIVSLKKRVLFYHINKSKMYEVIEFYNKKQKIIQNS